MSPHPAFLQHTADMRRYHPHLHGATALQGQTASGPITIESNVSFLTADKGCAPLDSLLKSVQSRILYLQTLFFKDADVESDPWWDSLTSDLAQTLHVSKSFHIVCAVTRNMAGTTLTGHIKLGKKRSTCLRYMCNPVLALRP